ncbi:MAG: nucleotidyltransferase domain-containing protein [Acidobacteria bacterium]|nr:nucleotidyltransferase domain-containing protein [Acidobacteriota bacterium]
MEERIKTSLLEIERDEGVRIFYACESGSRAWGFPSADSDYDVRFLYVRARDWYLSVDVEKKRDVIERPITDELDVSGWDIRKALMLLKKSNPPLLEWLGSPIIYREKFGIADRLRKLLPEYYSPKACLHHYLHMAQGNYREYLKGETVRVKKYFYVLRPILAIKWIEEYDEVVPTEFGVLVERIVKDGELKAIITDLIERKKSGGELDRGPVIPQISEFIRVELERLEKNSGEFRAPRTTTEKLNEVFRASLSEVWGDGARG